MANRIRVDSKPIRRGDVYCSRRCGAECTHAAYLAAMSTARRVVTQLGKGWHARVFDNLGWHWSVYYGRDELGISFSGSGGGSTGGSRFMLIVNGFGSGGLVLHGRSPSAMIRTARRHGTAYAERIAAAASGFPR